MEQKMKAAVLERPGVIKIEELDKPSPGPGEILVRVKSVGVCGSDIHYYRHGRIGAYVVEKPIILGHESSGEVAEVGEGVNSLRVGDRVSLEPGIPCRKCVFCKTGRYNLCPDVVFMATPPVDGAFVEYVTFPEDFAFKLPDNVSFDEGALIEPLAVGVYASERAGVKPGLSAVVLGAGPIGLVTLQAAKAYGASPVVVLDISDFRLNMARKLGADFVIDSRDTQALEKVLDAVGGGGADLVFEAAGAVPTIQMTTKIAKRGGKVVFIGLSAKDMVDYNVVEVSGKELDVLGIFRYANVYRKAIDMVSAGKIDLKSMITHHFPLERTQDALDLADTKKNEAIKVIVNP
ncbi:MAG TPA: NAD(P)-dependent alcohol dehydrogenase [Firmicutes bacterium]|nr:NAD(P)-dependent alcohol dehydrogenase [Bacillota bacterium]